MKEPNVNLTPAEWNVMECFWERSPLTGREVVEQMQARCGWSRSTTLTLLSRMEKKGALGVETEGNKRQFHPLVCREDAALQETESFIDRIYSGSLSLMVSAITRKQSLSQKEIDELYAILKGLEEKGNG